MKIIIVISALILLSAIMLPAIFTPVSALTVLKLYPVDDVTVISDRNPDLDDQLRYANTGKFDFLKASYSVFMPLDNSNIESLPFITFDLSGLVGKWVEKATLHLHTSQVNVTEPKPFTFEIIDNNWNEDQITYANKLKGIAQAADRDEIMIDAPNTWYQLDVTSFAKENADGLFSIAPYYYDKKGVSADLITFHSKETSEISKAPYLEIEFAGNTKRFYETSKSAELISTSIEILNPTDDLFLALNADLTSDQDELRKIDTSDLSFLKSSYSINATGNGENLFLIPYLKFDLDDVQSDNLVSAILKAKPLEISHFSPSYIDLFDFSFANWNESEISLPLTFDNSTKIQNSPSVFDGELYHWDITDSVKNNIGSEYIVAMMFHDRFENQEELVTFRSLESGDPENSIYLELKYPQDTSKSTQESNEPLVITLESEIISLNPTDDAFVLNNFSDPDDIEGYQITNTGDLDFLKSWYAMNATENQEQLISNSYLKFDLTDIESDKVINANLKLVPKTLVTSQNVPPSLELSTVDTSNWNESEINYTNRPLHDLAGDFIINTIISEKEIGLYNWDLTELVKENSGSELSVVYSNSDIYENTEEIISFYSKETENQNNAPVLEIEYIIDENKGGCLIATATYGTELAPQVQLLRELRDNTLLQTESGTSFMNIFNGFYYSFSPVIADYERENPLFKELVKITITPMISSLSILNHVDIDSEFEMISYGLGIMILNLGMYGVIPAILVYTTKKRFS
jgi:hypothetical protein